MRKKSRRGKPIVGVRRKSVTVQLSSSKSSFGEELRKVLSYSTPGAYHLEKHKRWIKYRAALRNARIMGKHKDPITQMRLAKMKIGTWDGKTKFYKESEGEIEFPTPLFHTKAVKDWVKETGAKVTRYKVARPKRAIKYRIPKFPKNTRDADYSYQQECVDAFTRTKTRFGLLHLAPAAGKSEIIANLIWTLGLATVVSAPGKEQAVNIYDRLVKYFGSKYVGMIGAGRNDPKKRGVTVVCWASVRRKRLPRFLFNAPLWLSDECHREVSAQTAFARGSEAVYRVGLSASIPGGKAGTLQLGSLFGPEVRRIKELELEQRKVTAVATHIFLRYPTPKRYQESHEEMYYHAFYRRWIVKNTIRNKCGIQQVVKEVNKGKRGLVFVRMRKHGEVIERMLDRRNITCEYVHGDASDSERKRAQNRLRKGKIDVLIGTTIINTGINIKEVQFTLSLVGEYAHARKKQEVGRGSRWIENKISLNYDMDDRFSERLLGHTKKRIKVLKETGCKIKRSPLP